MRRTQVAIIGGGPAGLLLSHLLHRHGIDSVVLERQTKAYVLKRIRAGVLEYGSVKVLRDSGAGERMDREGHAHDGSFIVWQDREPFLIDTKTHTGRPMWSHGQTAITEELYRIRERDGGRIVEEAENVQLHDLTDAAPKVTYEKDGASRDARLRLHRRLRRVSRRVAAEHSEDGAQDLRARLSVRLARNHVGDAAGRRGHLRPARARLRARFAAQSDAEPLLHPVRPRHADRGLAGRAVLGRAQAALSRRHRAQDRDRPVDRKVDRAPAQLRRRADAPRPAFSRRRRRAYRPADRGERAEPRGLRRFLSSARVRGAFSQRATTAISKAIRTWRCDASGRRSAFPGG